MFVLPKFLKKVVASLLLFLVLFGFLAKPIMAAGPWYDTDFLDWHKKVYSGNDKDIFGERYTAGQVQWVIYSIFSFIIDGPTGTGNQIMNCAANLPSIADLSSVVATAGKLIFTSGPECQKFFDYVFQFFSENLGTGYLEKNTQPVVAQLLQERPISAVTYFKDIARHTHIIPEANAQAVTGLGFDSLNPILEIWKITRNITYSIFVIVIIILSFMIMFKVKLNPQTSVTIQSAIPQIIFALILVTFSYAIAGLLIDLMYLIIALFSTLMGAGGNVSTVFTWLTQGPGGFGIFGYLFTYYLKFIVAAVLTLFTADSIFIKFGMGLLAILMMAIGIIVLLYIGLKVTFILFKALAQVFLLTIIAPLQIVLGVVVPSLGFGAWIRSYASNLATFFVVGLILYLSQIFVDLSLMNIFKNVDAAKAIGGFVPGADIVMGVFDNKGWPPLLGTGNATVPIIFLGTSFVLLTVLPKTVELIQALIKGGQFNYGAAISEASAPVAALGQYASTKQQAAYRSRVQEGSNVKMDDTWNAILDAASRIGVVKRS